MHCSSAPARSSPGARPRNYRHAFATFALAIAADARLQLVDAVHEDKPWLPGGPGVPGDLVPEPAGGNLAPEKGDGFGPILPLRQGRDLARVVPFGVPRLVR